MEQVWVPKPTKIQGMSADLEKTPDVAIAFDVELPIAVKKNWEVVSYFKDYHVTKECGYQSLMKFCKLVGNQRTQQMKMLYAY